MKSLYNWVLVLFSVLWISLAIRGIFKERQRRGHLHWVVWGAGLLVVFGALGFFGSALAASGVLKPAYSVEWPAGYVRGVVQRPDGTYVVPLVPSGRVQLYDSKWNFKRGWQIDAEGGNFKIVITDPALIDIYTARGRFHYTYTQAGELVGTDKYSDPFDDIPDGHSMTVPTSLLLWPFSSPFSSWGLIVLGMVILKIQNRNRTPRPRRTEIAT